MKEKWPIQKKPKDVHSMNRPMGVRPMGPREYSAKMLIHQLWCSADGKVADEVKEAEDDPDSTKILMIQL